MAQAYGIVHMILGGDGPQRLTGRDTINFRKKPILRPPYHTLPSYSSRQNFGSYRTMVSDATAVAGHTKTRCQRAA